jgi:small subunit ribosomal protein S6
MKKYEIAYIVHPDLENTLDKVTDKVNAFVGANGQIINEDIWGKKRLAYPIAKQNYGIYIILSANLKPSSVAELENLLKLTEEVIRFLVITTEGEKASTAEEKKVKKIKTEPAKEEPKDKKEQEEEKEIEVVEQKEEPKEEPKEEKTEKKPKVKVEKEVSEEERLEELDKKLKQILGDEK